MRPRRKMVKVTHEDAVAMVRAYHLKGATQASLKAAFGCSQSHIARIVHGDSQPEAFAEVFPDAR